MAKLNGNPYENLAHAIIIRACNDYRIVLKMMKLHPKNKALRAEAVKLENFFRSPWYQVLTTVDGEVLIQKIRVEIAEWRQ